MAREKGSLPIHIHVAQAHDCVRIRDVEGRCKSLVFHVKPALQLDYIK